MSIILPTGGVAGWLPRLVPEPNEVRSAFGTHGQRFTRLGRHWAMDVDLHVMTRATADEWTDLDEETDTLVWPIEQNALGASEGTPRVNGAAQLGNSLDIDGATPGLVIPKGRFVSVITGGQRFVYQLRAAVTVDGSGEAALPIRPLLRVSPANDDVVEIAAAKLEGYASWRGRRTQSLLNRLCEGARFTIEERL